MLLPPLAPTSILGTCTSTSVTLGDSYVYVYEYLDFSMAAVAAVPFILYLVRFSSSFQILS